MTNINAESDTYPNGIYASGLVVIDLM